MDCGIAMVGRCVIRYHDSHNDNIELDVMSQDRKTDIKPSMSVFYRIYRGGVEYMSKLREYRQRINQKRYDVIHITTSASFGIIPCWAMLKMAKKCDAKTVVHFHFGRIPEVCEQRNWEYKWIMKVCRLADTAILIDEKSYNTLLDMGIVNVCYLPNPVAPAVLDIVSKSNVSRIRNQYLFVGHVWRAKGIYELVEAIKSFPEIKLKVIGAVTDIELQALKKIAGDSIDRIEFLGAIPHNNVIEEMLKCDVFVLPTYTEGFPNVILESMACGCPIIASSVGAIPQMLASEDLEKFGLLIQPQSVESLKEAIATFINDEVLKNLAGINAQKRVNKLYSMPVVWEGYKNIWNKIANHLYN